MSRLSPEFRLRTCIVVIAIVLVMTCLYFYRFLFDLNPTAPGGDTTTYLKLAERLRTQHIYAEDWPDPVVFRAWRPPLYPVFLALLLSIFDYSTVITAQYVLLFLTGLFMFHLYNTIFDSFYGGVICFIVVCFYPPFISSASYFWSETLFNFFLILFLVFFILALQKRNSLLFYACAGVLLGLSSLTRTIVFPLLQMMSIITLSSTLVCIFICINQRRQIPNWINYFFSCLPGITIFVICAWIVILPYTIRNYFIFDKVIPINTANGMNFYFGTLDDFYQEQDYSDNKYLYVSAVRWQEEHDLVVNPLREKHGEADAQQELFRLGWSNIFQSPVEFINFKLSILSQYLFPRVHSGIPSDIRSFLHQSKIEVLLWLMFIVGIYSSVKKNIYSIVLVLVFFILILTSSLAFYLDRFVISSMTLYILIAIRGVDVAIIGLTQTGSCIIDPKN